MNGFLNFQLPWREVGRADPVRPPPPDFSAHGMLTVPSSHSPPRLAGARVLSEEGPDALVHARQEGPSTQTTSRRGGTCSRRRTRRGRCGRCSSPRPRRNSSPSTSCRSIPQKVLIKLFCKSQFPHKSVNLSFIITNIKIKLTDFCGS